MSTLANQAVSTLAEAMRTPKKSKNGFSLIELLIVMAIMGILAAIAYPSYSQYVIKTKRSDAHLALLSAAQTMERCKSTSYSFINCTLTKTTSPEGHYSIALTPAPTASTFTIVATPLGGQTKDTECTTMLIDHRSTRSSTPGAAGQDANMCWN